MRFVSRLAHPVKYKALHNCVREVKKRYVSLAQSLIKGFASLMDYYDNRLLEPLEESTSG